ncbi:MAG: hypothetical protein PVJ17_10530 [Lysobacterales bacterium]|jgi:hypothetical protein
MGVKARKCKLRRTPFRWFARPLFITGILLAYCLVALAQDDAPGEPAPEPLPGVERLAAALSQNGSRQDALLTIVAVSHLLETSLPAGPDQVDAIESGFRQDREWLDRLAGRYGTLPVRGTELDTAAWYLLLELDQQRLAPDATTSPLGPGREPLELAVFDRSHESLAAAVLPEALAGAERNAVATWQRALDAAAASEPLHEVLLRLRAEWFDPWPDAEAPLAEEPAGEDGGQPPLVEGMSLLQDLAMAALAEGPPDRAKLERLRFVLLTAMPGLDVTQGLDAGRMLALAAGIDGLHERRYLCFNEALLWLATDLLMRAEPQSEEVQPDESAGAPEDQEAVGPADATAETAPAPEDSILPGFLTSLLPEFSQIYAREFAEVDPRINANLAAVFDVVQYLHGGTVEASRLRALRLEMADAVAQFVLVVPDMDYYFDQPVRRRISQEIDICISIVANRVEPVGTALSREQYDGCLESLVRMSETLLSGAELSGDPDGPFGVDQLRRELELTPWQRINYALGYLHDLHPRGCPPPAQPLPNPLEWANLATTVAWFAGRAPVYFQTPQNEALIADMRQQGMDLLASMMQQVDCIAGTGTGLKDPVLTALGDYRQALSDLVAGLREAELAFRAARLKPGSDVVLHGDASQHTAFRSEGMQIGPCDPERACNVHVRLEATRALIGLFPDPYLIADQTRLGSVEICYDNVQWVNRRSVPVSEDDPWVANYYGHLSFDLVGRYHEKGRTTRVFGSNLVSPDEYHYLFAAATDEVLNDSCPSEWVGTRIVTRLGKRHAVHVVPDRLTYLAAARRQPAQVLSANWSRNEEWRDAFVTGLGVTPYEYPGDPEIKQRVNRHLKALYQAEQAALYSALLRPPHLGPEGETRALYEELEDLSSRKALVSTYLNLFYPQSVIDSDAIRGLMEGSAAMLDAQVLRRFRQSNIAMSSINDIGRLRLEQFQAEWTRQPEAVRRSGSPAVSVAHALLRLDALYREFFVLPRTNTQKRIELSPDSIDG